MGLWSSLGFASLRATCTPHLCCWRPRSWIPARRAATASGVTPAMCSRESYCSGAVPRGDGPPVPGRGRVLGLDHLLVRAQRGGAAREHVARELLTRGQELVRGHHAVHEAPAL